MGTPKNRPTGSPAPLGGRPCRAGSATPGMLRGRGNPPLRAFVTYREKQMTTTGDGRWPTADDAGGPGEAAWRRWLSPEYRPEPDPGEEPQPVDGPPNGVPPNGRATGPKGHPLPPYAAELPPSPLPPAGPPPAALATGGAQSSGTQPSDVRPSGAQPPPARPGPDRQDAVRPYPAPPVRRGRHAAPDDDDEPPVMDP